jgi:hypothetical protein
MATTPPKHDQGLTASPPARTRRRFLVIPIAVDRGRTAMALIVYGVAGLALLALALTPRLLGCARPAEPVALPEPAMA